MVGRAQAAAYPPEYTAQVVEQVQTQASANQDEAIVGALRSIAFVALAVGLLWAIGAGRMSARAAALALSVLVAVDLWSIERKYWRFSEPASRVYASDPAIDAIKNAPVPSRVVSWDPLHQKKNGDALFRGDAFMVHDVRMVAGYHGNELGRYQQLLDATTLTLNIPGLPGVPCYCKPELWRHENAQFMYSTLPDSLMPVAAAQLGIPAPQKVLGPVTNAAGSTVYLYRLAGENPPAWVATTMVKGTDEQALATILDPRFEQTRAAIIDTGAAVAVPQLSAVPSPSGIQANVTRFDAGRIDVTLSAPAPAGAALVVSENFYPGWRATAGGTDVPTMRANFNLIGVALPAGAREIQLRFTDPAYQTGKLITWLAIALAMASAIAGVILDRRRRAAVTA